ncbi:cupin domain-containing protein [Beijerinckia mobilis]|uniref:cupin domain-containing protein n=1 Tax=Beijerinckia mobilis TaxID=231434 RepID=UPI00054D62A2|nr:cupin domain-containing protein [Beijerinckia mobilis]
MRASIKISILGFAMTGLSSAMAMAADTDRMIVLTNSAAAQWGTAPAFLPKGVLSSVFMGDPGKPGTFVLRLKLPAHTIIAPHTHPTAETVTLVSGTLMSDMGETIDQARAKKVETGGFFYLPAGMAHSVWTTNEPAEVEVKGEGPFSLKYINPADDPSGS